MPPFGLIHWLDLVAVAVAAASGAFAAARKGMDIGGFLFVTTVTGIGGGTFRDLILNRPVFWIARPDYVAVCLLVAVVLFFAAHHVEQRRALLWADAVSLGLFSVVGAEIALDSGALALIAIVMGVMTATFGGVIRDVLCAEVPLIFRKEVYATAAAAGAATLVALHALGFDRPVILLAGFAVAFCVRGLAIALGLSLPVYRRPGERPEN